MRNPPPPNIIIDSPPRYNPPRRPRLPRYDPYDHPPSSAFSSSSTPSFDTSGSVSEFIPAYSKEPNRAPRDWRFWMLFSSILLSTFVAALDMTAISTTGAAVVVHALDGKEFTWIGWVNINRFPASGGLATIFGRRAVLIGALSLFLIGSVLCGASHNMSMLIGARSIQGIGCGGILSLSEIVVADLVPLNERGIFLGYLGASWAIASALGPPLGGALSEHASWRLVFFINVPCSAIALLAVWFFLDLKVPQESLKDKMKKMDWTGNFILIISSTCIILSLTWGGALYSWQDPRVIVPLVLGFIGLSVALWFEKNYVKEPTIPFELLCNRSALSGYLATFIQSLIVVPVIFYLPVYFQAVLSAGPTFFQASGIDLFPTVFLMVPGAIGAGAAITYFQHYRWENYMGWVLATVGLGVLSCMRVDSPMSEWIGFQTVFAFGMGLLYASTQFPILASLPTSQTAHALSFFTYVRTFGQVWGITTGSTILQNDLGRRLPKALLDQLPGGLEIIYSIIPVIKDIDDKVLQLQVRTAFAESLQLLWRVLIPISAVGFIMSLFMEQIPMHADVDEEWGYKSSIKADMEKA